MAQRPQTDIDSLAAPKEDGAVLVWPDAGDLPSLAVENRRLRRALSFEVLGRPARAWMSTGSGDGPVIMTGHQPAFFHPGVWAKNVVATRLAARLGGVAEFLAVDSDVPHQFGLQWPEDRAGRLQLRTAAVIEGARGRSYEQLPAVSRQSWEALHNQLPEALRNAGQTALESFLKGFLQGAGGDHECFPKPLWHRRPGGVDTGETPVPQDFGEALYVSQWTGGVAAVEQALGLSSPRTLHVSDLFSNRDSPAAALAFTAHLLSNAEAFAAAYNDALADYRARRGIRGSRHPIPDLARDGDRVELPFWLLHDEQPRRRLFVSRTGREGLRLWAGTEATCEISHGDLRRDPAAPLSACLDPWRIRPRALALTMFARLFLCDLFIHGIGGAKYDQITDEIIRRFFGAEPPAYACVSATLRLPLPVHDVTETDRLSLIRRARDLRYNPQRHAAGNDLSSEAAAALEARGRAIAESQRLRQEAPADHEARRGAFNRIRQSNATVLHAMPEWADATRDALAGISVQLEHNRIAASREWFFALYPLDKLARLHESLPFAR